MNVTSLALASAANSRTGALNSIPDWLVVAMFGLFLTRRFARPWYGYRPLLRKVRVLRVLADQRLLDVHLVINAFHAADGQFLSVIKSTGWSLRGKGAKSNIPRLRS